MKKLNEKRDVVDVLIYKARAAGIKAYSVAGKIGYSGIPDVLLIYRGESVWVECKIGSNTLQLDQKLFLRGVKPGRAFVARKTKQLDEARVSRYTNSAGHMSMDQFLDWVKLDIDGYKMDKEQPSMIPYKNLL